MLGAELICIYKTLKGGGEVLRQGHPSGSDGVRAESEGPERGGLGPRNEGPDRGEARDEASTKV